MKKIKQLGMAVVIAMMIGTRAYAGTIHTGVSAPPPPPPQATLAAPGDIYIGENQDSGMTNEPLPDVVLMLLQSVLSVF